MMLEKTKHVKSALDAFGGDYQAKIKFLHNQYQGQDCYLLSCGPSLNQYSKDFLNDYLKDKLTLSVKTSYERHRDVTDFHFFNCCNLPRPTTKPYHYDYNNTIAIASSNFPAGYRWSPIQKYDIFFKIPLVDISTQINHFVSINKEFDKYKLDKQFERPVGPGIMYETVLFMAVHLGVKSINTIGWDLTPKPTTHINDYDHFYNKELSLCNPGSMMHWEIEATTKASKDLYYWLKNQNIELNILTDNTALYEGIPRIKI